MKLYNRYWYLGLIAAVFLSCNKNTNQLPPIKAPAGIYERTAKLDGVAILDVFFEQTKTSNSDTVWMWVKNLTPGMLLNTKILVEICDSLENYDMCGLQQPITIDSLPGNDTAGYRLLYINKNINFNTAVINVGILQYEGTSHILGNIYSSIYAGFNTDTNTSFGNVRGYVLADGNSVFRFKWQDAVMYNAKGIFTLDMSYRGQLLHEGNVLAPLVLDSIAITDSTKALFKREDDELSFAFKSETGKISDTITSIFIKAKAAK